MTILIDVFNKKTTTEEITEFENKISIKLPQKYKQFLLETNGGKPEPYCFDIPEFVGKNSMIDFFNGLNVSTSYGNLEKDLEMYNGRIPDSFIPIGCDPADNLIFVGIKAPYLDKIYFWDYEDELDRRGLSKMDMSNMYWVADDIYEFLDKLTPEEEIV